jgi:hypothetical protein
MAIKTKNWRFSTSFSLLLASAMLCGLGALAYGQSHETMPPQTMPPQGDNDTTTRQLADMDNFLDGHPEIAEQLRKDPSLVNNREFVENHPALGEYLEKHPGVREELRENPNAFMHQENRYDRREERREGDRDMRGDRDITRRELAGMDRFLDSHPEMAEQLKKDPSLINNREFVENHPALQEYLQKHPEVREEVKENPNAFMQREERYDRREDGLRADRDNRMGDRDRGRDEHGGLTNFGQFLGGHSNIAAQLSQDPSLANNKEYLANHPELAEYLKSHPTVTQQLAENPQAVMNSNWVQQNNNMGAKPPVPKAKPNNQ